MTTSDLLIFLARERELWLIEHVIARYVALHTPVSHTSSASIADNVTYYQGAVESINDLIANYQQRFGLTVPAPSPSMILTQAKTRVLQERLTYLHGSVDATLRVLLAETLGDLLA